MASINSSEHHPLIILVPGEEGRTPARRLRDSVPEGRDAVVLDLGNWDNPHRNTWVNRLNLAIGRAQRPVELVADGLACLAVIWWATFEQPGADSPVVRAALLSPPDLDRPGTDPRVARFGAVQSVGLPFPATLVASGQESAALLSTYRRLAADWDCTYGEWNGEGTVPAHVVARAPRSWPRPRA